jgi:fumarylpyruvate hydrolase
LVVAIGKEGFQLPSESEADDLIFGYGLGCDLTRRDLQAEAKKLSRPWDVAKGFDYSAPCGPIVPKDEATITDDVLLTLEVNGEPRQEGRLGQMIWSIPEMILCLSQYYRLLPGDLIFTGTPAGVGPLNVGDTVKVSGGSLLECVFSIAEPESK